MMLVVGGRGWIQNSYALTAVSNDLCFFLFLFFWKEGAVCLLVKKIVA